MPALLRRFLLVSMLVGAITPASAQSFVSGNWSGKPLLDNDGKFTRCAMTARYQSGSSLIFDVDPQFSWRLWVQNPNWDLRVGDGVAAVIVVDGRNTIPVTASAVGKHLVMIPLRTDKYVVENMRRGQSMEFVAGSVRLPFSLQGTNSAIGKLVHCVRIASQGTDDYKMLTSGEASVLLSNLLSQSGVVGFSLEPPSNDNPTAKFALGSDVKGYLRAARGRKTKLADEYANDSLAAVSHACGGEFTSSKQSIPSIDGSVTRRILTTCRSGLDTEVLEITVIRKPDGFLIEIGLSFAGENKLGREGTIAPRGTDAITDAAIRFPSR